MFSLTDVDKFFSTFWRMFFSRFVKTAFHDFMEIFGTKFFFNNKNNCFVIFRFERQFFWIFSEKVLPMLPKQHFAFPEQHFEAKGCFWIECIVMIFMFSGCWEIFLGFAKQFRPIRQIVTPRVQNNVFRKHRCFEKTKFFDNFRSLNNGFWILEWSF